MTGGVETADVEPRLDAWAKSYFGAQHRACGVAPMPGNSGLSFGFDVVGPDDSSSQHLVIRMSPPGVQRRGNTDVLRQVPLIEALSAHGVPVADVVWWTNDEQWFGTDALIQRRLAAKPLHMWTAALSHPAPAGERETLLRNAVQALVHIHSTPVEGTLADWERGRSLDDEIHFWDSILHKSTNQGWVEAGEDLRDALLKTAPPDPPRRLYHGDFQTNNILFDEEGAVVAVVDWEIAGLGAQMLDLGWFALFTDPNCWDPTYASEMRVTTSPKLLRREYEKHSGTTVEDYNWYRSLACFRFGAISALNVRLHRTGRHVDANWDRIAPSVDYLFKAGQRLLHE